MEKNVNQLSRQRFSSSFSNPRSLVFPFYSIGCMKSSVTDQGLSANHNNLSSVQAGGGVEVLILKH